jgi:thioredoxin-related protein
MNRTISSRWSARFAAVAMLAISTTGAFAQQKEAAKSVDAAKLAEAPKKRPSIYDKKADTDVQVAKATERAKRDSKRVLVMFGGDWCGWCHKLHELFASDAEIHGILANDYELVMVDLAAPHAEPLLERCKSALSKEELQKGVGYPFLSILDGTGKIVTSQRTDPLEEGNHHDPKKVREFLKKWALVQRDARSILDESLARASSEDKKVFLSFATQGCGWCHRLDEWLMKPEVAAIIDRDFIVAKVDLDRMKNGKEVMLSYRTGSTGGIPWYTVLDPKGKSLATADGPDGNIGYPLTPKEIDQFLAMMKGQIKHIDEAQLSQLRKSLEEAAVQIKAQQEK